MHDLSEDCIHGGNGVNFFGPRRRSVPMNRLTICAIFAAGIASGQGKSSAPSTITPASGVNPNMLPSLAGAAISGRFQMEDGTPPPDRVRVELVCNSQPTPQGWSDSKGNFSIQLGQNSLDETADLTYSRPAVTQGSGAGAATEPTPVDKIPRNLDGCELRGALLGYSSGAVPLSGHRRLDSPDVGTLLMHRLANVEGLTISATTGLAPAEARKSFEKGEAATKKRNFDEAQKDFKKAVDIYPKYAVAWLYLGRTYELRRRFKEAMDAYRQSIAADDKYLYPYERLYILTANGQAWPEVLEITGKVIHLDPVDFPRAYYFNAIANLQVNELEKAEKSAREAVRLDLAGNPRAGYVLGVILARNQKFAESAQLLRAYLQAVPVSPDTEQVKQQLAVLEKMEKP
jgi:Flp pilus assembly protein TadD